MFHKDVPLGDAHFPHAWEYADAAARTGATGFVAGDVNKLALQLDTNVFYILTAVTPTWAAVSGGAGSVATDTIWDAVGDLAVGSGANTAAKLSIGTALQVLRVNAGATALEYATPATPGIANHAAAADLATSGHPASIISIPSIGVTGTVKEALQHVQSAGQISGFAVVSGGANLVDVAAGEVFLRATAVEDGELYHVAIGATTGLSVPLNTTRYIVAKYNAGTPTVTAETLYPTENYTQIYLAEVHNLAGTLHIHNDPRATADMPNRILEWLEGLVGTRIVSGEIVSDPTPASRKVAVSAGSFWDRFLTNRTTTAFDSSATGTFSLFYRDGVGGFTEVAAQTDWPNTQYDNGTGALATLANNKYGVIFVLREFDNGIYLQYGQAEYASQTLAEEAVLPATRPEYLDEHAFYCAKIVFIKSGTAPLSIIDIRPIIGSTSSGVAGSSIHNDLTGLQGGAAGEYYHITAAQATIVGNTSGTNTGDQTLPVKATNTELNTGADDAKFATALALAGSGFLRPLHVLITQTSGTYTLSAAESKATSIEILCTLVGNLSIIAPVLMQPVTVHNLTSGAFTVSISGATGLSATITQGDISICYGDGTNWEKMAVGAGGDVATDAIWDAAGDLAIGTGANTAARLAIGTNGQVLTSNGTTATWVTPGGNTAVGSTLYLFQTHGGF